MIFYNNDEDKIKKFLKKEEKHKVNAISFYELFLMCKDRFLSIENELFDLKRVFKNYLNISNIYFKEGLDGEIALVIEFYDDKKEYLILSMDNDGEINIILDTTNDKYIKIINYYKPLLLNSFKIEDKLSISKSFVTTSSSKLFNIKGLSNELFLSLNSKNFENYFRLSYLFNMDSDNQDHLELFNCKSNFDDIKSKLSDLKILRSFLSNIMIDNDDIPKVLMKK